MKISDARKVLGVDKDDSVESILDKFQLLASEQADRILDAECDEEVQDEVATWRRQVLALETSLSANSRSSRGGARGRGKSGNAGGKGDRLSWPEAITVDAARGIVSSWAAEKHGVPSTLLDGPLQTKDASFAEYTIRRLVESRMQQQRTCAGNAPPRIGNTFDGSIQKVALPAATALREETWEFILAGSVATQQCSRCKDGRQRCGRCSGSGHVSCHKTERCDVCSGSGEVRETPSDYSSRRVRCTACHGRGEVDCRECGGTGRVPCDRCAASGWIDCPTCEATGFLTSYGYGLIERKVFAESYGGRAEGSPISSKVAKAAKWQRTTLDGAKVPEGVPASDSEGLRDLLARQSGELLRKLDVSVLPVTAVEYEFEGQPEILYIVGRDHQVVAPAMTARKRRKVLLIAGAVVLVLAVVAGVLSVLGWL